jgi:Bacterial Ig-like domain (group 1)
MKMIRLAALLMAGVLLVGCGGASGPSPYASGSGTGTGGTGGTGGTPTTTAPSMTIGLSTNTVTAASPATVTATVRDATGNAVANQLVSFSLRLNLGAVSPATALTNSAGQAVTTLSSSSSNAAGADEITATASVNGAAATATQGFQLNASTVTINNLAYSLSPTALSAFGQATLTATLSNAAGVSVSIGVTSACVTANKATLTPAAATTTTGTATFTYKDLGCGATNVSDTVTATVTGTASTQTLSLPLTSPAVNSIGFVSASPEKIFLKGSGFVDASTVTFKVLDAFGGGLPGKLVSMRATTYTGGLTLDSVATPVQKTSDANGNVAVLVNSGTVPTPVGVVATLVEPGTNIATSSSNLSITVGLPTQSAFSLAQGTRNIEGFNINGTPNSYTVIASDRMSNPVPNGTAINFVSEGGQIEGAKPIVISPTGIASATANFVSAGTRPEDGRITIVAYSLGEESFVDANGDNAYNLGEAFQDLGDAFVSRTYDFAAGFDAGNDQRIPQTLTNPAATCINVSSAIPGSAEAQLALNVEIPSAPVYLGANRCDGVWGRAIVRQATETVLSTSSSDPVWFRTVSTPVVMPTGVIATPRLVEPTINLRNVPALTAAPVTYTFVSGTTLSNAGKIGGVSFLVRDSNGVRLNPVAAGTVITVEGTTGLTMKVTGGSPVASTTLATSASVSWEFADTTASGTATLHIKSPSGLTSDISFTIIK